MSATVTLRLDENEAARIDKHVERMRSRVAKVLQVTRTDAVRDLIDRALVDAERAR